MGRVRIGIVGTGGMGNAHAKAFAAIPGCEVVAACDVLSNRVRSFARKHKIRLATTEVEEIFGSADVDAVCIVTPDSSHAELALHALQAGKHVLCEKPLAVNYADAAKMSRAARNSGLVNMVNFSYRKSGALTKAKQLVDSGRLGEIRHVEASYLQSWLVSTAWGNWRTDPQWLWRLSTKHGSRGVLGDIGVHIVDFASYPIGKIKAVNCTLKTFRKAPRNRIGEYHLDANDSALIQAEFSSGAVASITATRWATGNANSLALQIHGTEGALRIDLDSDYDSLEVCLGRATQRAEWKRIDVKSAPSIYKRFVNSISRNLQDQPSFARGAEVQKVLEACFESSSNGAWVRA